MKIEKCYVELGLRVRLLREMKGITQANLAKVIGLTRTSIVNVEGGRQRLMLDSIQKLAKALKVNPDRLVKGIWHL